MSEINKYIQGDGQIWPAMACIVVAEVETIPGTHIISKLLCKPIGYSYILAFRIPKKFQGHQ